MRVGYFFGGGGIAVAEVFGGGLVEVANVCGGGGIAVLCGASRQFAWHWSVLTVAVATAPVPLLVLLGGLDVRDLVRLHDFVLETIGSVGVGWW